MFQILFLGYYLLTKSPSISITARTKLNGTSSKSTNIPVNSRVNLLCKVRLNKTQAYYFNLMMVTFTLPTGKHIIPKKCTVNAEQTSKRCKIILPRFSLRNEGKYTCHAQYFSGRGIFRNHEDIFLCK